MLEQLFGSKTRARVLQLLFTVDESLHVREIARRVGTQLNAVRRELDNLDSLGIVKREKTARRVNYHVDPKSPFYPELKTLMAKSQLFLRNSLVSELEKVGALRYLILCGAFMGVTDAPTDMLLVGTVNRKKLESILKEFERIWGREVRYTIMSPHEFKYRNDLTDRFLFSVLSSKKMVIIDKYGLEPNNGEASSGFPSDEKRK
ncbi:MAG: winged helix-turn-helix domain-containing protein [bacterium]|nr:winged helix-turn-helix domain-containing protein [bacterium]